MAPLTPKSYLLMALITFTGYPASGKSRRAQQLLSHLNARLQSPTYGGPQLKLLIVSDRGLNIPRSAYDGQCEIEYL